MKVFVVYKCRQVYMEKDKDLSLSEIEVTEKHFQKCMLKKSEPNYDNVKLLNWQNQKPVLKKFRLDLTHSLLS